jgi:hypothetical protein
VEIPFHDPCHAVQSGGKTGNLKIARGSQKRNITGVPKKIIYDLI